MDAWRSHWLLIGGLWLCSAANAAPEEGLFSSLGGQTLEDSAVEAGAMAPLPRLVRVDTAKLNDVRREVEHGGEPSLILNLAEDAIYRVMVESTAPTSSGYSLAGRIADMPEGRMVLVVNGDILAGTVWTRHGTYTIRTEGAGVCALEKVDPAKALPLAEPRVLSYPSGAGKSPKSGRGSLPARSSQAPPAPLAENETAVVDVLVLWTPQARAIAGGLSRMRASVDERVAVANEAYRLGGVSQRLQLVGAAELNYQNATADDIERLPIRSDGFLDEIHQLRDSYAADIVSLIAEFEFGGIALLMADLDPAAEALAFNMVNVASGPTIFAHELGHNMGLQHDRYTVHKYAPEGALEELEREGVKLALFPYSFGYVNPLAFERGRLCWHTIMAYPDQCDDAGEFAVSLPRFSNADQTHPAAADEPLGVALDAPATPLSGPTHAVRSLNESRHVVAAFRDSASRCEYALSVDDVQVDAAGGSFSVRVETDAACSWQAHHQADFLAVATTTLQTGPGELVYSAEPNPGLPRTGVASIAAEGFVVRQLGAEAPLAVCERSSVVRRRIVQAAETTDCNAVTVWDLQEITRLSFVDQGPLLVQQDDFQGLVNLSGLELQLANGDLSPLAELTELRALILANSGIVDLRPLAGLTRLQHLDLSNNQIVDVTPLAALQGLLFLFLQDNAIGDLTPLAPLGGLVSLDASRNAIGDLSPLADLPLLFVLLLEGNRIDDLKPLERKAFLRVLLMVDNAVSDAAPLLTVPQLAQADLRRNPLTEETISKHIAVLLSRGVQVLFDTAEQPPSSRWRGWRLALDELRAATAPETPR